MAQGRVLSLRQLPASGQLGPCGGLHTPGRVGEDRGHGAQLLEAGGQPGAWVRLGSPSIDRPKFHWTLQTWTDYRFLSSLFGLIRVLA